MIQTIQFCLTGICFLIYVPIILNAIQQIQRGEVILYGKSLFRRSPRRYTGAAVWAYAGGQALSGIILIIGGLSAIQRDDLLFLILTIIVSWLVGLAGLQLADRIGYEELEDPATEAMNILQQIFSNTTGVWNRETKEQDQDDKNQPIIITFGSAFPKNPNPAHPAKDSEDDESDTSADDSDKDED